MAFILAAFFGMVAVPSARALIVFGRPAGSTSSRGNGLAWNSAGSIVTGRDVDYPFMSSLGAYRSQVGAFTGTAIPEPAPADLSLVGWCWSLRRSTGGADRTRR
jgi:hypothetical protein